ncbi:MAG: phosphoenolpyruvate carboxylase [Saprospiraceae bacterium]|nr:phosphoenolpyruvate carboxylase [Saprospiraceae bacterium]
MLDFSSPLPLLYHTYNSLFLSLPFRGIEETGTHLALFAQACEKGFSTDKTPEQIIEDFWNEYAEHVDRDKQLALLFHFIQYVERQVVLFDAVEDALFAQLHDMNGPGSLNHFLARLDSQVLREKLLNKVKSFSLRLVLTAHPTQFYPGKVLGIMNDLVTAIKSNNLVEIRLLLMQLGKTAFVNREKPTPYDEAVSLGWYLENVLYQVLPELMFRLLKTLGVAPDTFDNPRLLALGFWPGGDRDGNPFVTSETTLLVARLLREGALRGYYRDIRQLKRRLTFRDVEETVLNIERKLYNTLYTSETEKCYSNCKELLNDLAVTRTLLVEQHDALFLDDLDRFMLKIKVFGFYFATLDIRQDSRKHTEVWEAIFQYSVKDGRWKNYDEFLQAEESDRINYLLGADFYLDENDFADGFVKETIRSFRAISEIQQQNGELGCHRYIISNCRSAYNVAEVLGIAQLVSPSNEVNLDIVPLFETIDDLGRADEVMQVLYSNKYYAQHLAARGMVQHIMLGFSDGTKDGGYLRSNWSIYRAKEALTRVSREYDIKAVFFDGRGGPPGRGGGNNASYYAAHGQDIENQAIHVTIQGQTVSSTYGTQESASFNIERLLTAGLENFLFPDHARELSTADRQHLDQLADAAYEAYLDLKNDPAFVPYLEKMTPLKWYGDSNIASRPTKRNDGGDMKFDDLRAIPFVGAWAQMKQNIPGYYGIGAAVSGLPKQEREEIGRLYQRSLFFRTLMENSMQSLSKSNFLVTQYLEKHPQFGGFWHKLHTEYAKSLNVLEAFSESRSLLTENPVSKESIALRERIVLPLITIQQYALQQLQSESLTDSEAETYRKLVLRSMFGIINAARNAA